MKKLILFAIVSLFSVSVAYAGNLPFSGNSQNIDPVQVDRRRGGDNPARPVPEPGTMALASMGLIALGAAARGRRK